MTQQSALSEGPTAAVVRPKVLVRSVLKGALIASLVFALAWIRWPLSAFNFEQVGIIFLDYGILIVIFAMVLGLPFARLLDRFRIDWWWTYLLVAAVTGALLAAFFSFNPNQKPTHEIHFFENGPQEVDVENPHRIIATFSPWTRSIPIVTEFAQTQFTEKDFIGSVIFGAIIGGVLGLSTWHFRSREPARKRKQIS